MSTHLNSADKSAIMTLFKENFSQREISNKLGIPKTTVGNVLRKFLNGDPLVRKSGTGRPPKLNKAGLSILVENVDKNPRQSARKSVETLSERTGITICRQTAYGYLKSAGYGSYTGLKKPMLSKKNILQRVKLGEKWLTYGKKFWESVIFSDESKINLNGSDGREVIWRKAGESLKNKNLVPTFKRAAKGVMVWGCFSAKGVGKLVFIDGIMDRYKYLEILADNLQESAEIMGLSDFCFQQDNDPKHTSKLVREYFEEKGINLLEWPSQSPDMNPIEHLWAYIKAKLRASPAKNVSELKTKIIQIWNEITPELTGKLANSMPKRVLSMLRNKGGHTSY
jgi:transposase